MHKTCCVPENAMRVLVMANVFGTEIARGLALSAKLAPLVTLMCALVAVVCV